MANTVVIDPKRFAQYAARLHEHFIPTVVKAIQGAVQNRCRDIMIRRTAQAPPASDKGTPGAVNYGTYKAAWKAVNDARGATIVNDMPYAPVIERGRRPAPVNREGITSLARWAQRKMHVPQSEARAAAFAIAMNLKKRPLKARRVMTDGVDEMTKAVNEEVEHDLARELSTV